MDHQNDTRDTPSGSESAPAGSPAAPIIDRPGLLPGARMALVSASTIVILLGIRAASSIVAPIILALVLTFALSSILGWLERRGVSTKLAYTITLVGSFLVGSFIALFLSASLASFAASLPGYQGAVQPYFDAATAFFARMGIDLGQLFEFRNIDPGSLAKTGLGLVSSISGVFQGLLLVAFVTAFMLLESTTIGRKVEAGLVGRALERVGEVTTEVRSFVTVSAYLGAAVAILETILLLVLGVPNAFLWGIISFFFSFIPYIGFVLALIPPAVLGLLTGGWVVAAIVIAGYLAINTATDNVIKPHLMGVKTNLSPLAVFLSLVLWGWVLGPLGGLLAVPATLLVKGLLFEVYPEWRWAAVLLGNPPEKEGPKATRPKPRRHVARPASETSG